MLNSISWSEFLTAITIVLIGYYLVISFRYYGKELLAILNGRSSKTQGHSSYGVTNEKDNLIGVTVKSTGKEVQRTLAESIESDQINFANESDEESNNALSDSRETIILGTVSDLVQEIKTLTDSSPLQREELTRMITLLLSRYPQLSSSTYKETICHFILSSINEKTQHTFTLKEVRSLWPHND
jgi:hypothetical protein